MFDRDVFAVAAEPVGTADRAVRRGVDRRTGRRGEINALVPLAPAEHRVGAHPVAAGHAGGGHRDQRGGGHRAERRCRSVAFDQRGIGLTVARFPTGEQLGELGRGIARRQHRLDRHFADRGAHRYGGGSLAIVAGGPGGSGGEQEGGAGGGGDRAEACRDGHRRPVIAAALAAARFCLNREPHPASCIRSLRGKLHATSRAPASRDQPHGRQDELIAAAAPARPGRGETLRKA